MAVHEPGHHYVLAFDAAGKLRHWGGAAERLFGWSSKETIGKAAWELAPVECVHGAVAITQEVLLGTEVQDKCQVLSAAGEPIPVLYKATPVVARGQVMGFSVVGERRTIPNYTTLKGLQDGFRDFLIGERNRVALTAYTYENSIQRLERWTGRRRDEISPNEVRRFLRTSAYHAATKNSTLVAFKAFKRWGVVDGLWEPDATLELQGPKVPKDPKPALTPDDVAVILDATKRAREIRVIYLGLFAGLRVTESASIDVGHWKSDRLRFSGKGTKTREVPLHGELAEMRDVVLSVVPSRDTLKHVVRSLANHTGIPFTSHTLRRTFAVTLRDAGVQEGVLEALLGHSSSSTLRGHYAPVSWNEKVDAVERLSYPRLEKATTEAVQGRLF